LVAILTPLSAAKIKPWIDHLLAATALSLDIVLEELKGPSALKTRYFKHILWLPESRILPRAFHNVLLLSKKLRFLSFLQWAEINFLKSLPTSPAYRQAGFAKRRSPVFCKIAPFDERE
jgi:hypothetical protein